MTATRPAIARAPRRAAARAWSIVALLTLVNIYSNADKLLPAILLEQIKADLHLSDTQLGLINGVLFIAIYCFAGIPIARYADRRSRRTVLVGCITLWSLMTIVGAASQRFFQLALTRSGVALGEAGCLPSAQSIISDLVPAQRRSTALSILMAGSSIGVMVAMIVGGQCADRIGWRGTMAVFGLFGLLLAALVFGTVAEPRRGAADGRLTPTERPALGDALRIIWAKPSFRHIAAGSAAYTLFASALSTFMPAYLIRRFAFDTADAGLAFGLMFGLSGGLGILAGGYLSDRLGARDVRWNVWIPALGLVAAAPAAAAAFLVPSSTLCLILLVVPKLLGPLSLGTSFALVHRMVDLRMRALSSAIMLLMIHGIGSAFGPALAGIMSDLLAARYGRGSLGVTMAILAASLAWAAFHFFRAAVFLPADLRDEAPAERQVFA